MNIIDSGITFYQSLPLLFKVLFAESILLGLFALTLFVTIIITKFSSKRKEKRTVKLQARWKELLIPILMESDPVRREEYCDENIPELVAIIRDGKFREKVLRDQLLFLNRQFRGTSQKEIHRIYRSTGLKKQLIWELYHPSWQKKVGALVELREIGLRPPQKKLMELLNSDNAILRAESILSLTQFYCPDGLKFLEHYKFNLSEWEQIKMFNILKEVPRNKLPLFHQWIENENESVKIFCMRMAGWFRQHEAIFLIRGAVAKGSEDARVEALRALRLLGDTDIRKMLKETYPFQPQLVRKELVSIFGEIASLDDLKFLDNAMNEEEFDIKVAAARAIASGIPGGREYLEKNYAESGSLNGRIVAHVLSEDSALPKGSGHGKPY